MTAIIEKHQGYDKYFLLECNMMQQQISKEKFEELKEKGEIKEVINR
ncbi:MAG: hypothetical protein GY928_23725 [Colwellia sp.]|nr:hypothetical protein [Colwellia sp.]